MGKVVCDLCGRRPKAEKMPFLRGARVEYGEREGDEKRALVSSPGGERRGIDMAAGA